MANFEPEKLKEIDIDFTKKSNVFVFPDNFYRTKRNNELYDHLSEWSNGYGFVITKKPEAYSDRYYSVEEYEPILITHLHILKITAQKARSKKIKMYIFKLDHDQHLWNNLIKPSFEKEFENDDNVIFLWEK
jgi:hypothetical protein